MQSIPLTDPRLTWAGAISVQHVDQWTMPWRIPHEDRELFPPAELQARTAMPAGVRLTFRSNTTTLHGQLVATPEMAPIDLCCDGELIATVPMDGQTQFHFDNLPHGDKLLELWLPQFGEVRLETLAIDEEATLTGHTDRRPRWITYGSSITQCRTAASPTQTWPAIVARNLDLHLTCLGFGGQCHLDPMIARMLHDQPADFLSICVGINIYGAASLSPRTFRGALIGFIQIVRDAHPEVPFVVMSPIYSPPRETTPNAVGFTLQAMREEVAAAVDALQRAGDFYLYYVNGLDIFGAEYTHLLPDALHPDAEGYRIMGQNFTTQVAKRYFPR
ncbi:MAG: hypothetical protein KDE53_27325 [Caldilineaceae bacterium]|nr:hypothetical protein [Caldilineaceae bacterium]